MLVISLLYVEWGWISELQELLLESLVAASRYQQENEPLVGCQHCVVRFQTEGLLALEIFVESCLFLLTIYVIEPACEEWIQALKEVFQK